MGFWEKLFKFLTKTAEKGALLVSGVQIGDSVNDEEKVTNAINRYEINRSAQEIYYRNEDTKTLQIIVLSFIGVVILFIIAIGVRMLLTKNNPPAVPSIALTTLREGNRTINSAPQQQQQQCSPA